MPKAMAPMAAGAIDGSYPGDCANPMVADTGPAIVIVATTSKMSKIHLRMATPPTKEYRSELLTGVDDFHKIFDNTVSLLG